MVLGIGLNVLVLPRCKRNLEHLNDAMGCTARTVDGLDHWINAMVWCVVNEHYRKGEARCVGVPIP